VSHPEVLSVDQSQPDFELDALRREGQGTGSRESQRAGHEPTGDQAVDEVLSELDRVADAALDRQIEAGEQVNLVLQARLADLGKE
jgi:hypothetical protein